MKINTFHSQRNCFSLFIIHSISSMFYVKGNMETIVFYSFFGPGQVRLIKNTPFELDWT